MKKNKQVIRHLLELHWFNCSALPIPGIPQKAIFRLRRNAPFKKMYPCAHTKLENGSISPSNKQSFYQRFNKCTPPDNPQGEEPHNCFSKMSLLWNYRTGSRSDEYTVLVSSAIGDWDLKMWQVGEFSTSLLVILKEEVSTSILVYCKWLLIKKNTHSSNDKIRWLHPRDRILPSKWSILGEIPVPAIMVAMALAWLLW